MPPIRIVYTQSPLAYGAVETYLRSLIERLDRERFEPWLVCPDHPSVEPLRQTPELERRVVALAPSPPLPAFLRSRGGALRSIRPALVHCADLDPPMMVATRVATGATPLVVTHNTPELRPTYNVVGRAVVRGAWAARPWTIYTSGRDRETSLVLEPVARERTAVIPYGVDLDRFAARDRARARAALGIDADRRVVGMVAYLREQKGHTYLLQAAERLAQRRSDLEWLIVGDGELRGGLEQEAHDRGVADRVRFLGDRADVPEILSALDVFALSSTFEGMCFAVAEALAAELPVVATDVGGVSQSVVQEETGLLVPPRDPDALTKGIERLLDEPDTASRVARAGRERVQRLYSLAAMVEATERFYLRALGRRT